MTLEHIEAVANGGKHEAENLHLAHQWCNAVAGSMSVEEKEKLRGAVILGMIRKRDENLARKQGLMQTAISKARMRRCAEEQRERDRNDCKKND